MARRAGLTLAGLLAASLVGLGALLGLLLWGLSARSERALLDTAEVFRAQRASRAGADVEAYLEVASRALTDTAELVGRGLLDPDDPDAVEAALFAALLHEPRLDELTLTRADALGFDEQGARRLAEARRWQVSLFRESDGGLTTLRTRPSGSAFLAERRRRPPGGSLGEGRSEALPLPADDPTRHLTFEVTASAGLEARVTGDGPGLWSDIHYAERDADRPEPERRVVVTCMRVLERGGRFLGVVRAGLLRDGLDALLHREAEADDPHRLFLFDERGRLISRWDPGDPLRDRDDELRVEPERPAPELSAALALATAGEDGPPPSGAFALGGTRWLASFLVLEKTQGWRLGIVVPEERYTAPLVAARTQGMLLGLAALAAVVAGGVLTLRALRGGLRRIEERSARMRDFDFTAMDDRAPFRDVADVIASLEQAKTALRAMGRYVPVDLVRQLYRSGREPVLGGEATELTVLFSDIADFTTLSEALTPDDLAALLGRYLEVMTGAVHAHRGIVDKFIGDAVMALWNAPTPVPDHPRQACLAALACRDAVRRLQDSAEWSGRPRLRTRFGIHTDRVMVGHFGAPTRMSYTALGDGVNLASRLEGLNKVYGTEVLVSGDTRERCGGEGLLFRHLDAVAVKGKRRPVEVFELVGPAGEGAAPHGIARYEEALGLYRKRSFPAALEALEALGDDAPARVLAARCRAYLIDPPPEGWDGSYTAREK